MDVVTYALAKKLVNGVQSGLSSATVDNTNCSITFNWTNGTSSTLTFPKPADGVSITNAEIVSDELIFSFSDSSTINVGNVKGAQGEKGDKGDKGDTGEKGDTGDTGFAPSIEVVTQTDTEYTLKINNETSSITTPNLRGDSIFIGNQITSEQTSIIAEITGSHIGDIYINADTSNLYKRDDAGGVDNSWCYKGNIQGIQGKSNYDLAVENGFIGTEADYLASLVGQADLTEIVFDKPDISLDTTQLKTWYYYQIDSDGASGTAWKYRADLTKDLPAGKYAIKYNLKWFISTTTTDVPAETDKDIYKYYTIMDVRTLQYDIIRETIADGTTTVLETVQGEQATPTAEYTIMDTPLIQLGQWVQTLYIGATKETASEVTLKTGVSVTGFVTNTSFESIVGNINNLKTSDKSSVVNAINEHDALLRNSNADTLNTASKNVVGAINELDNELTVHEDDTDIHITADERIAWNDKEDSSNKTTTINSASTDEEYPSAKAIYNYIINSNFKTVTDANDVTLPIGKYATILSTINLPVSNYGIFSVEKYEDANSTWIKQTYKPITGEIYVRSKTNELDWTTWKRVCTTSVEDVPQTAITFADITNYKPESTHIDYGYRVLNGICYFQVYLRVVSVSSSSVIICNLPKPANGVRGACPSWTNTDSTSLCLKYGIYTEDSTFRVWDGSANQVYMLRVSYPVAES